MWQASVTVDGAMVRTMPTAQREDVYPWTWVFSFLAVFLLGSLK